MAMRTSQGWRPDPGAGPQPSSNASFKLPSLLARIVAHLALPSCYYYGLESPPPRVFKGDLAGKDMRDTPRKQTVGMTAIVEDRQGRDNERMKETQHQTGYRSDTQSRERLTS
eukprot:5698883-Pleurochrysis_carterae.AAC.2